MKHNLNNERGIALVAVLLMITVMSILAVALMGVTATNVKLSSGEREFQSVYYVAESGLNYRMHEIKNEQRLLDAYQTSKDANEFFQEAEKILSSAEGFSKPPLNQSFGNEPEVEITVEPLEKTLSTQVYRLQSQGTLGNRSRTVSSDITLKWDGEIKNTGNPITVYANDIVLGGSASISGDIAHNKNGFTRHGNASRHYGERHYLEEINLPEFPESFPQPDDNLSDHIDGEIIIDKDVYIEEIASNFSIDVSNNDVFIRTKKLHIDGSKVELTGGGRAVIFVEESLELDGSKVNLGNKSSQLTIFYKAGKEIKVAGGTIINASLFLKDSKIELRGNSEIFGSVIAKEFDASGASSSYSEPNFSPPGPGKGDNVNLSDIIIEVTSLKEQ